MTDYRTAPIDSEFKQLLCFTEKVARDAGQITAADIAGLRAAGFSDRAVLDTAHVAGFFSYMNRVVQALGADSRLRSRRNQKPKTGPVLPLVKRIRNLLRRGPLAFRQGGNNGAVTRFFRSFTN